MHGHKSKSYPIHFHLWRRPDNIQNHAFLLKHLLGILVQLFLIIIVLKLAINHLPNNYFEYEISDKSW